MQEITETIRENGVVRQLRDVMVGEEGRQLSKLFDSRRAEVLKRAEATGRKVEIKETRQIGRNDPCPCGSKEKFKKCCGSRLPVDDERIKP